MPTLNLPYMTAFEVPAEEKTKQWEIRGRNGGTFGYVRWYSPWRQYCFFPCQETSYGYAQLTSLLGFLSDATTEEYKQSKP